LETDEETYSPRGILILLATVAILVLVGVGAALAIPLQPSLGGGVTTAAAGTVIIPAGVGGNTKLNYSPAVITVIIGVNSTVTWTNNDSTTHTVTATDNSFNSGDIKAGVSWTHTFSTPGNYSYYCIYHSAWMKGTVIVKSS
jgi:plastocyanin